MLQRAASNAYSWWWASHIRTKQSKWLEENLHDTEEKVTDMLEIIDNDGDSFAQRAEMYYNKRTELLNILEEIFRSYRSLAERFDYLSKDLQSANRTIATVFPDQVPYDMEDEDSQISASSDKAGIPKARTPKKEFSNQSMFLSRKGQPKKAAGFQSSGLSKEEALVEIDKLQKEMLALQTQREFMKSSYEHGYKKFSEIEDQINEKQTRVCDLQDEFAIGSVIDDNEGRTLMATQALKTCQESLDKLKEKHEQSTEEVRVESRRVRNASQKFEAIRNKFNSLQTERQQKPKLVSSTTELDTMVYEREDTEASDWQEKHDCMSSTTEHDNMVHGVDNEEKESVDIEALRKIIGVKLQVGSDESLTMPQLAENIDDLVKRVIGLETAVFSEKALVKRLKSEADELQEHVKTLEEDKEALIEGSDSTKKKINELETELSQVKDLVKTVIEQNISLKTHFTEAISNFNNLSVKLQKVEATGSSRDVKTAHDDAKADKGTDEHETELSPDDNSSLKDKGTQPEEKDKDVSAEGEKNVGSESGYKLDGDTEKGPELVGENKDEKKHLPETAGSVPDSEVEELETDEEDQPNWRQLYLSGLDDREKILLDEYSSVLKNYKQVRKKLNESDKKNRTGFFQLALQIKELMNAVASRDRMIQSLRRKLGSAADENEDGNWGEDDGSRLSTSQHSDLTECILQSPINEEKVETDDKAVEQTALGRFRESAQEMRGHVSAVEDRVRSGLDDLLEENLEFWLRFSTSVHQIRKYQNSVHDLKDELSTLREKIQKEGSEDQPSMKSVARPIYSHFREIQTELTLWLENNEVLKDQIHDRNSSLCNFQDEIARVTNAKDLGGETGIGVHQAAKFQGEVLNMKQELKKVGEEMKAGFTRARQLKQEVEKIMEDLEKEIRSSSTSQPQSKTFRSRIPLQSFLFGIKLKNKKKKASLQKQVSYLIEPKEPSG